MPDCKTAEKRLFIQLISLLSIFPSLLIAQPVHELTISTTYQAEDVGIPTADHRQCRAWRIFWNSQNRNTDLSIQDIELLAVRRKFVSVYNAHDAHRYEIPEELLQHYIVIHIHFEDICKLHPRIVWVNSTTEISRYNINTDALCENLESNSTNEEVTEGNRTIINNDISQFLVKLSRMDTETETSISVPFLFLNSTTDADKVNVSINPRLFFYHQSIAIDIQGVCSGAVGLELYTEDEDFFNSLAFDVSNLGMSPDQIKEFMKDDPLLDDIMLRFENMSDERPFPSTQILPFLKKVKYDQRTPPSLLPGHTVQVKIGLFLQSISNFELTTMDYDMDVWLRMAWKDVRLVHGLSKPILINEFTSLRRLWRPDPFFTNAKDAKFHRVTYLNFYMFIFPNGDVFMEMRTMLKNSCQLVFCKYPHDNQKCGVRISSLGFTRDVVEFDWFSRKWDAIRMKENLQLPELFLLDYQATTCNGHRKSGNYTCVEANFFMKRDIGYHVAQTYIPTTICVVFSWVGAWLPEEFVEGRILVSLTVFLTLSAENNAAKEDLPKVSYIKAIDLWFGFTSTFVFATMIQALIIISLENQSNKLKRKAEKNEEGYGGYLLARMLIKSRRYHKIARDFDTFCKVMYPVIFLLFLMIYGFVITEGEETKCLREDQA